jgi:hypothetical protein
MDNRFFVWAATQINYPKKLTFTKLHTTKQQLVLRQLALDMSKFGILDALMFSFS